MTLGTIFARVLAMSLTGALAILVVCLVRPLLRQAPAWLTCLLWGVVLVRLLCPVGLPLLPAAGAQPLNSLANDYLGETQIYHDNTPEYTQAVEAGRVPAEDETGARYVVTAPDGISEPDTVGSRVFPVLGGIWLLGAAALLGAEAVRWLRLRRRLAGCMKLRGRVYLADHIEAPFVMGVFRPRIYLPSWLSEEEQALILLHEEQHIRHLDHLTRLLAWAALCIHWFNPLVWLGFALSGRDMEIRCDENATRGLSPARRADYAAALLRFAAGRRRFSPSPAFSEGDAGARIRRLARWKRPAAWVVGIALVFCGVLAVVLLADQAPAPPESPAPPAPSPTAEPTPAPEEETVETLPPVNYTSARDLDELLAEYGFTGAEPYARWPAEGDPELTLWFDPDRGAGCGTLYTDGEEHTFSFDETGPCYYTNLRDYWPDDPFDPACALAEDPESIVLDYAESTTRDEAGRITRWESTGYYEDDGQRVPVRSDDYFYRPDGTLEYRDYYHNDRLFGTWFFSCRLYYDGQQRITRVRGYVTHGYMYYYYWYDETGAPVWQLCLDRNGGMLGAWMTPLS
ncbi:MAG TPA: hypothetical protein IAA46_02055 [Candidatus Gemmiger avium]|nr:hypothetical protein [Candidatus Gemmiger avium]